MDKSIILSFLQNITILLSFSLIYEYFWTRSSYPKSLVWKIMIGLLIGFTTIVIMMTPWKMIPGIAFDVRSVLISISGLFFGVIPTFIAVIFALLYRVYLGGGGVWMGVVVIVSSGAIGLAWRIFRPQWKNKNAPVELFCMGLLVHFVMLAGTSLLRSEIAFSTFEIIAIPVIIIYPLATVFLGLLMINSARNWKNRRDLKRSEEKFKAIANYAASWESWFNPAGKLIWMNDFVETLTGYTVSECLAADDYLTMITAKEDLEIANEKFRTALKGISYQNFEVRNIRKDGSMFWVSISWCPILDSSGNSLGFRCSARDITEIKKNQKELRQSELRLKDAQRLSKVGSFHYDALKDETWWSDELFSLYGIDTVNRPLKHAEVKRYTHPDQHNLLGEVIKTALSTGEPVESNYRIYRADGSIRHHRSVSRMVFDEFNKLLEIDAIVQDITDDLEIKLELLASKEKAEESDRLKSAFLMNMSHEIRTPMNVILGFLGLLKDADLDDTNRIDYINIISKSGERLLNTINNIIEISRIEAGESNINIEPVNIVGIMQEHYNFFRAQTVEKGLALSLSGQITGPDAVIHTDKYRINKILSNLINNAIKFTAAGEIEFGNYLVGDVLVFFVKDTGMGIPDHMHQIIFDRFIQADMKLTRDFEGSGLGLSIVKAYVDELGGKIEVQSSPGKGSTFSFSVPYKKVTQTIINTNLNAPGRIKHPIMRNSLILIAEDDDLCFSLLEVILLKERFRVIRTTNGEDTVRALKENPAISLILMDIKMPGMDGLEATRQIRHFNKTIPIIGQSAHYFQNDRENALNKGCNHYITKPINRYELLELVHNCISISNN